jgi:hypothetical protein
LKKANARGPLISGGWFGGHDYGQSRLIYCGILLQLFAELADGQEMAVTG